MASLGCLSESWFQVVVGRVACLEACGEVFAQLNCQWQRRVFFYSCRGRTILGVLERRAFELPLARVGHLLLS